MAPGHQKYDSYKEVVQFLGILKKVEWFGKEQSRTLGEEESTEDHTVRAIEEVALLHVREQLSGVCFV